ncbi:MAG: hypothetical protein IKP73_15075 [Bacteroidales bacterium]|nr:hypothetical protein [Bacteroidales bacterium]
MEQRIKNYTPAIRYIPILCRRPYIVEVNDMYTVGTDEHGVVILERKDFPSQFSKDEVKIICSSTFVNGRNEKVEPKVYVSQEWYRKEIELAKGLLQELYKLQATI